MPRGQSLDRRDVRSKAWHRSVDQIAGDRHHVGAEPVHGLHDRIEVTALDGRADVDVADLRDREAVQRFRKPCDGHVDRHDRRGYGAR